MAVKSALFAAFSVLVAAAVVGTPAFSGATFTSSTSNAASTVAAAADWTPPTVSMVDPGSPIKGTVALTANAADGETGIARVVLQYQAPNAASWITLCTVTAAPSTCSWTTSAVSDGNYDLRAIATDGAGYSTTSASVRTIVANSVLVVLSSPPDVVRNTVSLSTSIFNGGTSTYSVRVEYAPAGSTNWKAICTNLSSPFTCSWVTNSFANDYYDLRAVATSGGTTFTSAVVLDILVDNLAPVASMTDPGSPLSGFVTLAASASDAHSGVARVVIESAPSGSSTWTSRCTLTTAPYSCSFNTATLADGNYSFRAVVDDVAGNRTISASIANRVVDNLVSSVSVADPGAYLQGSVAVAANASSTAGITSVTIQQARTGTSTWTTICTGATSPLNCTWETTTVTDGLYDLRAVLVDGAGRTTTSATVASRQVDNTVLRGFDVQAVNGGGTAGRIDAGDVVTLTYTDVVSPGTIASGWNGAALAVSVRIQDGNILGLGNSGETLDVLRNGAAVNLGSVALKNDFLKSNKTATFAATMAASSTTVNGRPATVITLTLGSLASGGALRTVSTSSSMIWTPSSVVTDAFGSRSSTSPATELGALDRDF